ncbi:MAG: DNRLRE domain-containing protein [Planctomycetota bacterium]|nr:DNRLRE domain-containing protein [Planctomycetota bacterium]
MQRRGFAGAWLLVVAALTVLLGGPLCGAARAQPQTLDFPAAADATLYDSSAGTTASGSGEHLFVGNTGAGSIRRSVIRFDLSAIPPGSTVSSATLTLYMSRTRAPAESIALHRVLSSWGEGASNATGEEGNGDVSQPGDATWAHRFYDTVLWANQGGDFTPAASATTVVSGANRTYSWSSAGVTADVQGWVTDPASNHGWLLRGNEVGSQTAKRFDSRSETVVSRRPVLRVTFTAPVLQTGACCLPDGSCVTTTSGACALQGGVYQGNGAACTPGLCPQPIGACCLPDGSCVTTAIGTCAAQGGVFRGGGTDCQSSPCPPVLAPFVDALPIPAVAQPASGTAGGAAHYEIAITQFTQKLHRDLPATTVWGYAGSYPGPTIEARRDQPVTVRWINDLRDAQGSLRSTHLFPVDTCLHGPDVTGQVPVTVTHLHGGVVPPDSDGYPELTFGPGLSSAVYDYPNDQRAATLWYHDHALGLTRLNVYAGLAGFYIVRDAEEDGLNLPRGEFEIPLVIQDRSFNADGSLRYLDQFEEHFFGEFNLVNGKVRPFLQVKRGKYRFRVLNGANSRTFTLSLTGGVTFWQIGSDQGLLAGPVALNELTLSPGERADIVVDFAPFAAGTELVMSNSAPAPFEGVATGGAVSDVMKFVVMSAAGDTDALPGALASVPRTPESEAVRTRELSLRTMSDVHCGIEPMWGINDLLWDDITEFPRIGTTEIWSFINRSPVSHPMHMHLVSFQVLDRQDFIMVGDVVAPTGPRVAPSAGELGWKDTVKANPNQITRVIARFEGFAGRYAYHCHVLEHEDHEMMRQFEVLCDPPMIVQQPQGGTVLSGTTAVLSASSMGDERSFRWRRNGQPIADGPAAGGGVYSGAATETLTLSNARAADEGSYDLVVSSPCGEATTAAAVLDVVSTCAGDANRDGLVNFADITSVLSNFGRVYPGSTGPGDANFNGDVTFGDVTEVLSRFNTACP